MTSSSGSLKHATLWPMSVNFILASFNVWRHPGYVAKEGFKLVAYIITVWNTWINPYFHTCISTSFHSFMGITISFSFRTSLYEYQASDSAQNQIQQKGSSSSWPQPLTTALLCPIIQSRLASQIIRDPQIEVLYPINTQCLLKMCPSVVATHYKCCSSCLTLLHTQCTL